MAEGIPPETITSTTQDQHTEIKSRPTTSTTPSPITSNESNDNMTPDSLAVPSSDNSQIPIATRYIRAEDARPKSQEGDRSRSRGRWEEPLRPGSSDPRRRRRRRSSIWEMDRERKQRNLVQKLMDHHWVPDFLK